jgi:hypothetical protein
MDLTGLDLFLLSLMYVFVPIVGNCYMTAIMQMLTRKRITGTGCINCNVVRIEWMLVIWKALYIIIERSPSGRNQTHALAKAVTHISDLLRTHSITVTLLLYWQNCIYMVRYPTGTIMGNSINQFRFYWSFSPN